MKSCDLGKSSLRKHKINTGDRAPLKQLPGRIPTHQREIINQQPNELQANDRF